MSSAAALGPPHHGSGNRLITHCFSSICFLGFWFIISIVDFCYFILVLHSLPPSNSSFFFFFFFSPPPHRNFTLQGNKRKKKTTRIFFHKWLMFYKIFIKKPGNFLSFLENVVTFGLPKSLLSLSVVVSINLWENCHQ